ncbi:MAG: histidinol-phosphate transaminase [Chitinispirillales bacterium]|jgi:histidinol-phosphate aminotransferase|nr:histidinol-phosphate transaminase [Chitinispirillales bacterium]
MSEFDGKMISGIEPYIAGEQPKDMSYIKLNTNENPYSPSPKVEIAIKKFDYSALRLYPDPDTNILKRAISEFERVNCENVFCGNSSDEILAMAFMAFFSGKEIIFSDITYGFYPVWCNIFNVKAKIVPLKSDWTIDIENYPENSDGVVICNPNAPTGIALKKIQIEEFVKKNKNSLIICDEAYIDFGGESAVDLSMKHNNILLIKTLSKSYSLAGARVGYAVGNAELINTLNKVKNSFNSYTLDRLSIEIAVAAIKDADYFRNCCRKIIGTRTWISEELRKIGFEVLESLSNFIFASPPKISAQNLYLKLKSKGILIRYWNKERISNWVRISIGTDGEMKILIDAIKEILTNF